MTKERRLAIKMWEQIVEALEDGASDKYCASEILSIKEDFCRAYNLEWKHDCWFCQYVRLDWRKMPSREGISTDWNGCQRCPLYKAKADILDDDECGCATTKNTLWTQVVDHGNVYAARRILELLKGIRRNSMDFGMALTALKRGETVARKGWNGKGMFLTLQRGSTVDGNNMRNEGARKYYADAQCAISPHIDMKAADGTYVVGWLASQTDMLAEDWEIVRPVPYKDEAHTR